MATAAAWAAARAALLPLAAPPHNLRFAWPNEVFDATPGLPFVRVGGRANDGEAGELGANPLWTEDGAVECHILAPAGTGTDEARAIADLIVAAFRLAPPGPVMWEGWSVEEGADAEGGAWWVLHVALRYRTQSIATP